MLVLIFLQLIGQYLDVFFNFVLVVVTGTPPIAAATVVLSQVEQSFTILTQHFRQEHTELISIQQDTFVPRIIVVTNNVSHQCIRTTN